MEAASAQAQHRTAPSCEKCSAKALPLLPPTDDSVLLSHKDRKDPMLKPSNNLKITVQSSSPLSGVSFLLPGFQKSVDDPMDLSVTLPHTLPGSHLLQLT